MIYFKKVRSYEDLLSLSKEEIIERANSVNLIYFSLGGIIALILMFFAFGAGRNLSWNNESAADCIITQYGTYCK